MAALPTMSNVDASTTFADIIDRYKTGAITSEANLATELLTLFNSWNIPASLAQVMVDQITSAEEIISAYKVLEPKGVVDNVSDLPGGASPGDVWIVKALAQPTAQQYHAYAWAGGIWNDIGKFQGDSGSTAISYPWGLGQTTYAPNEKLPAFAIDVPVTLVATRSRAVAGVAATGAVVFTIRKNTGTAIGTVTFAAGQAVGTFSISSPALIAGDRLYLQAQAGVDATLLEVSITLSGDR